MSFNRERRPIWHVLSGDEEDFYRAALNVDGTITVGVHGAMAPEGNDTISSMLAVHFEDHRMKNYITGLAKLAP